MTAPLPLGLDKLNAVTEQKKRLEKLKTKFSVIVARHLNNLFIHLVLTIFFFEFQQRSSLFSYRIDNNYIL